KNGKSGGTTELQHGDLGRYGGVRAAIIKDRPSAQKKNGPAEKARFQYVPIWPGLADVAVDNAFQFLRSAFDFLLETAQLLAAPAAFGSGFGDAPQILVDGFRRRGLLFHGGRNLLVHLADGANRMSDGLEQIGRAHV